MKYTAIEQLIEWLEEFDKTDFKPTHRNMIEKAWQMLPIEKQQIVDARQDGYVCTYTTCDSGCGANLQIDETHEEYHQNTFKK